MAKVKRRNYPNGLVWDEYVRALRVAKAEFRLHPPAAPPAGSQRHAV